MTYLIYVYRCTCLCVHVRVYKHVSIYIHIFVCKYVSTCISICLYDCLHVMINLPIFPHFQMPLQPVSLLASSPWSEGRSSEVS